MKFTFTKNPEKDFFYEESKSNTKKQEANRSPEYTGQKSNI